MVLLAQALAPSRGQLKEKKPVLSADPEDAEGVLPPHAPIYLPLPKASEQPISLSKLFTPAPSISLGTPSTPASSDSPPPPVLTPYGPARPLPKVSPVRGSASVAFMGDPGPHLLRSGQSESGRLAHLHPSALTTTDPLNWKNHTPSFTDKPQAMIDLLRAIIQTHQPR